LNIFYKIVGKFSVFFATHKVFDFPQLLLGRIGTSGSFIYGIEPLPHQPRQLKYLDCEESTHKQSAAGLDSIALYPEDRVSEQY
jgi:hypothetical protein